MDLQPGTGHIFLRLPEVVFTSRSDRLAKNLALHPNIHLFALRFGAFSCVLFPGSWSLAVLRVFLQISWVSRRRVNRRIPLSEVLEDLWPF